MTPFHTPGVIPNMPIGSHQSSTSAKSNTTKRKEIYRYNAPWCIFSMNWSVRPDKRFRLAVGSFIEEYNNKVQVIYLDDEQGEFVVQSTFAHHYPTSKIMWIPDTKCIFPDLLATSGDYLRVWRINEDSEVKNECLLNNNKNSDYCAPLTSFDWNEVDPNIIGTSSIDTTCTIWALEVRIMKIPFELLYQLSWLAVGFRTRVSSHLRLVSWMYLRLTVDLHSGTRIQYHSLQTPFRYPLSYRVLIATCLCNEVNLNSLGIVWFVSSH
ncbi:unnamed protein product [Schistosoma mattheei]|uniref:WD_REPEATS_REGION domain-containing protein n=1 Tax=Schistosoma mattheei TaxID=31246 RepID=A0A3P7Z727_9TREM|nr:unnamed protein product [Schistosoma mattheei]